MNLSDNPYIVRDLNGGIQSIYKFENGYGASVVCHQYSYGGDAGLFELAVIKFKDLDYHLCYSTPVTDDVIGNLEQGEIEPLLQQINLLNTEGK